MILSVVFTEVKSAVKKLFSELPEIKGERVVLKPLTSVDTDGLRELTEDEEVYRYLPTFLFEKKYEDKEYVISRLYDECFESSIILGVYVDDDFCGLAEMYGYRAALHKASVGYRLLRRCWGKGIATEALGLMVKYMFEDTDIRIITASVMSENEASANVLQKNGFRQIVRIVPEDWGYDKPIPADKWLRTKSDRHLKYEFH